MASQLPHDFSILDSSQSVYTCDILRPFAIDEILCRQVGEGVRGPLIHIWRHQKALVLGLRDRKLPFALEAMEEYIEQGYSVTVRNSGGAAVPLDPGVINFSVILPNHQHKIDFHQDFELMVDIIQGSLYSFGNVGKGEVMGAYCPGDFDLSIQGKKFCGIAQRRQTKAFVVQAFIVTEGSGEERAQLVHDFYQTAAGTREEGARDFPRITPGTMASLQELCKLDSVGEYHHHLLEYLNKQGGEKVEAGQLLAPLEGEIQAMIESLRSRYEKR